MADWEQILQGGMNLYDLYQRNKSIRESNSTALAGLQQAGQTIQGYAEPYVAGGAQAAEGYRNLGEFNYSNQDFYRDPSYDWRLSEGLKGVERSAAAAGNLYSGKTLTDLNTRAQTEASLEYQNAYERARNAYETNRQYYLDPYKIGADVATKTGQSLADLQATGGFYSAATNAQESQNWSHTLDNLFGLGTASNLAKAIPGLGEAIAADATGATLGAIKTILSGGSVGGYTGLAAIQNVLAAPAAQAGTALAGTAGSWAGPGAAQGWSAASKAPTSGLSGLGSGLAGSLATGAAFLGTMNLIGGLGKGTVYDEWMKQAMSSGDPVAFYNKLADPNGDWYKGQLASSKAAKERTSSGYDSGAWEKSAGTSLHPNKFLKIFREKLQKAGYDVSTPKSTNTVGIPNNEYIDTFLTDTLGL